jgi:tetratricopeptide (TPR) repeat protein
LKRETLVRLLDQLRLAIEHGELVLARQCIRKLRRIDIGSYDLPWQAAYLSDSAIVWMHTPKYFSLAEKSLKEAEELTNVPALVSESDLKTRVYLRLSVFYLFTQNYLLARDFVERSLDAIKSANADLLLELEVLHQTVKINVILNQMKVAENTVNRMLKMVEGSADPIHVTQSLLALSFFKQYTDIELALSSVEKSESILAAAHLSQSIFGADVQETIGDLKLMRNDISAKEHWACACQIFVRMHGQNSLRVAVLFHKLAVQALRLSLSEESERYSLTALKILGTETRVPFSGAFYKALAEALRAQQKNSAAIKYYWKALASYSVDSKKYVINKRLLLNEFQAYVQELHLDEQIKLVERERVANDFLEQTAALHK